jgi:hypothetical protein
MKMTSIRATLAALLLAAGLVTTAGQVFGAPTPARSITVGASDDTYVRDGMGGRAGDSGVLVIGGAGNAVGYVKFAVPSVPSGTGPLRVSLQLTPVQLASLAFLATVEVHTVADTGWSEDWLTSANAPALGPVVAVSTLDLSSLAITFDVSRSVTGPGVVAFAFTTQAETQQRVVVSKEGGGAGGGPRLTLTRGAGGPPTTPPTSPPTSPPVIPTPPTPPGACAVGPKLVPSCGVLLGVSPGALTTQNRVAALGSFELATGRNQAIFHAYHNGVGRMFPTADEIAIAHQAGNHRILFLNWKPAVASWASIARGDPRVDDYLDRLAGYIKVNFSDQFFFTVHHEPENDVIERAGSGYTASDYAAMYRHVIERLRGDGVTNLVSVMDYMAFVPWNIKPWFDDLYPGDDVVDWVAWDMYGYSAPHTYGYGDFAEMLTRAQGWRGWPGIYAWASAKFPGKPLMVAEWGIWYSGADPAHQAAVFASAGTEISAFPNIKALVYFDTPHDQRGRSSLITATPQGLGAYRMFAALPTFQVTVP